MSAIAAASPPAGGRRGAQARGDGRGALKQRRWLRLREDQRDERFADWINAEAQAFERECADQNEVLLRATQHDSRCDVRPDEDFRGGDGLGGNRAVGILDAACAKRRDVDLLKKPAWDLGKIGARVNESFQLELAIGITWISDCEFHVEGSHRHCSWQTEYHSHRGLAMNSRTGSSELKAGS